MLEQPTCYISLSHWATEADDITDIYLLWINPICLRGCSRRVTTLDLSLDQLSQINWIIQLCKTIRSLCPQILFPCFWTKLFFSHPQKNKTTRQLTQVCDSNSWKKQKLFFPSESEIIQVENISFTAAPAGAF